jgi:hypothetical protein
MPIQESQVQQEGAYVPKVLGGALDIDRQTK